MEVTSIRTPGLGDASYVVTHGDIGIIVDPQRDVDRFLHIAQEADVQVRWVLETHLHNDYVSGGREAARRTDAELVLPAAAVVPFDHTPAFHKEDLKGPGLSIRPLHTPGHTPEHTSYVVFIDGEPVAVFSGGSLLVGAAGRSDLLGWDRARQLAIAQYHSVRRLAELPDAVELFPTHGEGSFCTASGAGQTTSTISAEKIGNPILAYADAESFVRGELSDLQPYPRYYAAMGPINLRGPEPLPDTRVPELNAEQVRRMGDSVQIVDGRPRSAFAAGHIPGSTGVELGDSFGVWVGWLLPFNTPVVLVLNEDQDATEAVVQLGRIGYDDVRGVLRGVSGWRDAGDRLEAFPRKDLEGFLTARAEQDGLQVLDIRSPGEWQSERIDGSIHRYLPDLVGGPPDGLDPAAPVWVICGSGQRASTAAGILKRQGYNPMLLDEAGVSEVLNTPAEPSRS